MKQFNILFCLLFISFLGIAQSTVKDPTLKPPLNRQMFHDKIDNEQKNILRLDGRADDTLKVSTIDELNLQATIAVIGQVNAFQQKVEKDTTLKQNDKLIWLRAIEFLLQGYASGWRSGALRPYIVMELLNSFENAMQLERKKASIAPLLADLDYGPAKLIAGLSVFANNVGQPSIKETLLYKFCLENPDKIMISLRDNPNVSFADSLLKLSLRINPLEFYSYAASNSALSQKMEQMPDSMIQLVVRLSKSKSGQLYFPFLDGLNKKTITTDEIDKVKNDSIAYYRLLVKTQINYAGRMLMKDTPFVYNAVSGMLKRKAVEPFVNTINGLHDNENLDIRFKIIKDLSPQELYYLIVTSEDEIYTSSYTNTYKKIFERFKSGKGDSLLLSVNMDRYRKFITMAANYNTLDDFLKRMSPENSNRLMRAFCSNLEKDTTLEDAVDVANAYASIKNKPLNDLLKKQVDANLQAAKRQNNQRAIVIYDIMQTLFNGFDSTKRDLVAEKYNLPPVLNMPNKDLKNDSGRIIMQMFFYGDKSGPALFNNFLKLYPAPQFKITMKEEWAEIRSTGKGVQFWIFANKALDETLDLDAKAQKDLCTYLSENDLYPTITVHRGHSYYLKYTVEQMFRTNKVVILGSCGAYHSLADILKLCPDAHIVASKQTGTTKINTLLIKTLNASIMSGQDLNWPTMWNTMSGAAKLNGAEVMDKFDDYIPPHKNLGAIFIKAFRKVYAEYSEL